MSQIKKYEQLPPALLQAQQEQHMDLRVGDHFIRVDSHRSDIVRIVGFEQDDEHSEVWYVQYQIAGDWEATEWGNGYNGMVNDPTFEHNYRTNDLKNFKESYFNQKNGSHQLPRDKSLQEYFTEAKGVIGGTVSMEVYKPTSTGEISEDRALMHKGSKQALEALQQDLELKRERVAIVATFVKYEMERKRQELDKIKEQLYGIVAEFEKKITRIMRVITTIELYLGIEEELFQLQDGPKAKDTDPICFRQGVLYMDEEAGKWENGGIDDNDIAWFDEWLATNGNFKKLLPEAKDMVVLQPRRKEKWYTDEMFLNALMNQKNLGKTYLLIRNGECLYRIFTDRICIQPRLFPRKKDLQELLDRTAKEIEKENSEWLQERAKEKVDDIFYHYKQRAALMQGLIDRSEVFAPMAERPSIYKPDEKGLIKFIYDDEETLPSGRLAFWDWVKKLNQSIEEGSRVLITGNYVDPYYGRYVSRDTYEDRFYANRREGNVPELPKEGIYVVEQFSSSYVRKLRTEGWQRLQQKHPDGAEDDYAFRLLKKHDHYYLRGKVGDEYLPYQGDMDMYEVLYTKKQRDLTIKYNPNDTVYHLWSGDSNDRKYNIRFKIEKDDNFILNYDQIDLDDVNFYINSRVDRPNYIAMMPVLLRIRAQRLKEIANEKEFIRFVVGRVTPKLDDNKGEALKRTLESVRWWKYKNKWKRSIASDDTLALRMIEGRVLNPNYATLQHHNNRE